MLPRGLLPYHDLGFGIKRAMEDWPEIEFVDDRALEDSTLKTSGKIIDLMKEKSTVTIPELAEIIGVTERSVERNIQKLQDNGIFRHVGPAKGGVLGGDRRMKGAGN